MSAKTAFCPECKKEMEYIPASAIMLQTWKNKTYRFTGTEAWCQVCGTRLQIEEMQQANEIAFQQAIKNDSLWRGRE